MAATRCVDVVITGRVQGVSYRIWTEREARARGLSGHVRNRADGAVAAAFCGSAEAVAGMLAACRTGPPGARVDAVAATPRSEGVEPGFEIRG